MSSSIGYVVVMQIGSSYLPMHVSDKGRKHITDFDLAKSPAEGLEAAIKAAKIYSTEFNLCYRESIEMIKARVVAVGCSDKKWYPIIIDSYAVGAVEQQGERSLLFDSLDKAKRAAITLAVDIQFQFMNICVYLKKS